MVGAIKKARNRRERRIFPITGRSRTFARAMDSTGGLLSRARRADHISPPAMANDASNRDQTTGAAGVIAPCACPACACS